MPFGLRSFGAVARSLIGLGVVVLILFFLVRSLVSNWSDLKSEDIDVQPALVLLASALLIADILIRAVIWRDLLSYFSGRERLPLGRLTKVFLYSWTGRYMPGKVAYPVGRFLLGRSLGFPSSALVASLVWENVLLVLAASAFVSLTVVPSLAAEWESLLPYLVLPAVVVGGAVALHPRVLSRVLRIGLRLLRRESDEVEWLLPPGRMAKVVALYLVGLSLSGAALYVLIVSVTSYSVGHLPLAAGAFALAGAIGMVSLFAPAGIGVREGVLAGVLQVSMSVELAVLVALVARVWATVIDLLVVGGCFAFDYASGERILWTAIRGGPPGEIEAGPSDAGRS